MWSPNNEKNPEDVFYNSSVRFKWICPLCNAEFSDFIKNVKSGENPCPYCNNRRALPGKNSLADRSPYIAKFWSSNNKRHPDSVLPERTYRAKWICPDCLMEYTAFVTDMVSGEADCPYCNDRQVLPRFNSFAVRHEKLLQEWDMVNNYLIADLDQIGDRCQIPV